MLRHVEFVVDSFKKKDGFMISAAITHLASQLNQFVKQTHALTEDIVLMSDLVDAEGHAVPNTNNKLVVFLTRLEKDTVPYRPEKPGQASATHYAATSAPLYLNLYVMIAANFSGGNYPEALKLISDAIAFFQRHSVFDHQNSPGMDARIEKLVLDIENLETHELSNIWTLLGSNYLPSVLYKVRMVAFDTENVIARVPNVRSTATSINH
jgi:hypothetical protein